MLRLTRDALRQMFPRAPQAVIDAFVEKHALLDEAGISATRNRLAICLAQVDHETNGFAIPGLTESIAYTAERAAQIWPSRFRSAADVRAKFGTAPGWQKKMFDEVYGNRMGNRPGTDDGSRFIGRGGPQITGRDGYRNVGRVAGIDLEGNPELAARHDLQPDITVGFWKWKNLNPVADSQGLRGVTRIWNGGFIGMADREARYTKINRILAGLTVVASNAPDASPSSRGIVTASALNLRSAPNGTIIGSLQNGTQLQIYSRDGDWMSIRAADGRSGYVHANFVRIT